MQKLLRTGLIPMLVTALAACAGDAESGADVAMDSDTTTMASTPAAAAPTAATDDTAMLDPDAATREQLMTVQGVDATLADAIIAGRPYDDMTEVDAVLGGSLDEAQREQVYRRVWKRIDLNNASEEEILLIPGVGDRMLHEFEEYRPYQAIEQFRREMGKYVDDDEVARLEQYVEIR